MAYGAELKQRGYCRTSEGCAPGCIEEEEADVQTSFRNRGCSRGNLWRDARTCVPARDCTCRTPLGKIIAPGAVEESDDVCEVCQCLDNEYVCDNSRCAYSWSTPSIDTVKNLTVITTPKPRPVGPTKAPASCSGWSDWINEYQKPAWGDYESKSVAQLNKIGFCLTGRIAAIECRDAKTDQLWTESRNKDLVCSLEKGFTCMPARQGKGRPCQDFKIRYFCECSGGDEGLGSTTTTPATTTTPTTTTTLRPTTTIMIWSTTKARPRFVDYCPDEHLMPLLSNPLTVPDSAFVATTSKSGIYGPSSARFVSSSRPKRYAVRVTKSDLAWVAGKRDMFQHIQVDLGTPTFVYGFEISGSPANKEYVTSLFVLYSEDNQRFSYVPNRKGNSLILCLHFWNFSAIQFVQQESPGCSEGRSSMTAVRRIYLMPQLKLVTSALSLKLGSTPSPCVLICLRATSPARAFNWSRLPSRWTMFVMTRWDWKTA